jgi:hypothetical protein
MHMNAKRCLLTLVSAALVACAQQPVRSTGSAAPHDGTRIDYARYVTRPVPSFRFSSLYDWDSNDPGHVVVWVSPAEAYRLTLLGPCFDPRNSPTLLLSSHGGQVRAGLDVVIVGGDHCAIQGIGKLDARAIRALRHATPGQSGSSD